MRYQFSLSTTAFILLTFFYLSGCTKKISLPPSQGSDIPCKISFIYLVHGEFGGGDTLTFTYNSAGNPIFVKEGTISSANGNVQLIYDSHNMLTQYKRLYSEFNAEDWTIYEFAKGSDQPASDITYEFPSPDTGSIPPAFYSVVDSTIYRYDGQKRVSQTVTEHADMQGDLFPTTTYDYPYDIHGNLADPISDDTSAATYDDKVNFRRLSPVFQFIDRNYSQNNSTTEIQIDSYNEYGLPTHLKDVAPQGGALQFLGYDLGECYIQYDCSCGIKTTVAVKGL